MQKEFIDFHSRVLILLFNAVLSKQIDEFEISQCNEACLNLTLTKGDKTIKATIPIFIAKDPSYTTLQELNSKYNNICNILIFSNK